MRSRSILAIVLTVVALGSIAAIGGVYRTSAPASGDSGLVVRNLPSGTQTVSGTVTANQGTAAAGSSRWPVVLHDGTNERGTLSTTAIFVTPAVGTLGGCTMTRQEDLAATVVSVKSAAGTVYGLVVENNQGVATFVQVFNVASGSVVLGTTNPTIEVQVAASSSRLVTLPEVGVAFGTAISMAATTTSEGTSGSAAGVDVMICWG